MIAELLVKFLPSRDHCYTHDTREDESDEAYVRTHPLQKGRHILYA